MEGRMRQSLKTMALIMALCAITFSTAEAQRQDRKANYEIPLRYLINAPTAGTLPRGTFDVILRVQANGGIQSGTTIGLTDHFMIGASYGADRVISETDPDWHPSVEFNIKLRIVDEQYYMPALALGFSSEGYGSYHEDWKRFTYKSKGFYAVLSRSFYYYNWAMGAHFGVNYSLEHEVDKDKDPSVFFGFDTQFSYNVGMTLEYDMALNDDKSGSSFGKGRGYFNIGLKWLFADNLEMEAVFENLLNNRRDTSSFGRGLRFRYLEYF